MKKLAIAGASLALAAMPALGVFAATTDTTDTLTLTVPGGCNVTNAATRSNKTAAFGSVAPGNTALASTDPFTVTCNNNWGISVTTTGLARTSVPTDTIAASVAGGLDGDTSEWGLWLEIGTLPTGVTANNPFNSSYAAVDGTNTVTVAGANEVTGAVENVSITPHYKVSVAPGQAQGTDYTGTVTYTVAASN